MRKLKHFFSYLADVPLEVRIASILWLVPFVFSLLAVPYIIIEDLGTDLLLGTIFIGVSGLLISYGLSRLKRWAIYLFGGAIIISIFIFGGASVLFLIVFVFVLRHWKKFN